MVEIHTDELRAENADTSPLAPFGSREWLDYFTRNASDLLEIPWDDCNRLSPDEKKAIAASVQGFQLGESSEGKHLIKCAKAYAEAHGDPDYFEAIKIFIREEQRHARDLGRFLELNDIRLLRKTWPDTVFRQMRRQAGLELSVAVLVTAEIFAQVYYPALQEATNSRILRRICDQIIRDETPHVQFQCERLALLRRGRSAMGRAFVYSLHRILFLGTCFVVWSKHAAVFRRAGNSFRMFWANAWNAYFRAEAVMKGTHD